jgi:hypothetical protein
LPLSALLFFWAEEAMVELEKEEEEESA